jgi:hypothetical protein
MAGSDDIVDGGLGGGGESVLRVYGWAAVVRVGLVAGGELSGIVARSGDAAVSSRGGADKV